MSESNKAIPNCDTVWEAFEACRSGQEASFLKKHDGQPHQRELTEMAKAFQVVLDPETPLRNYNALRL